MHSLRAKMNICIGAISIICIVITAFISYNNAAGKLDSAQKETAQISAQQSAAEIDAWLTEQAMYVEVLAEAIETGGNTEYEYMSSYLKSFLQIGGDEEVRYDVYYTSAENVMASATDYNPDPTIDFTTRSWYVGAAEADGIYYESPYLDVDTGRIVITLSRKIMIGTQMAGVLAEDIFLDTVVDIVGQSTVPENSYAFLVDPEHRFIVHPSDDYGLERMEDIAGNTYGELAAAVDADGSEDVIVQDYDGVEREMFTVKISSAGWTFGIAADRSVLLSDSTAMVRGFFQAGAASLLISIVLAFIISNSIVRPIRQLTATVINRDLSQTVNIRRKDEVGKLANGYNAMMASLRGLMETLSEAVERIQASSDSLKTISEDVVGGAQNVKSDMDHIDSAIEEQTQSVESGRNSLHHFHSNMSQVQEQLSDMHELVQKICDTVVTNAAIAEQLQTKTVASVDSIHRLEESVSVLEERSRHINDIVSTIQEITSQTQMLALNAAIEASRAGEAGRGFAVVAQEIRGLSDQTESSSDNIRLLLDDVQKQIKETVTGLRKVAEMFEQNSEIAGEVHAAFGTIGEKIRDIGEEDQALSHEFASFVEAETSINDSFAQIDKNALDCSSYSARALKISTSQTTSVVALKDFVEELDVMSRDLSEKIGTFQM